MPLLPSCRFWPQPLRRRQSPPGESMTLAAGVEVLPLSAENRDGYQRTSFKHWIDEDRDGCWTRNEG
ncbi:hypothetical protein [Streptomyces niger]|uniref:hypothetical protein n=1 Tax=Streptomyces niger TaxID=66373 RepID=UPI00389A6FA0